MARGLASKIRLPGSSLLDRCIGRSTFQFNHAVQLGPFSSNITYDSFIKTLSKYEPTRHRHLWTYTTPFGRQNSCRLNLGSSKRTSCLHSDDAEQRETNIEVYEFACGSIRSSLFHILSYPLFPVKLQDAVLRTQYNLACWAAEKMPNSRTDLIFDSVYRSKLVDSKSFTSTQPLLFPKWCSSISLVRVLKANKVDSHELVERLNKEENPEGALMGKSKVNLSKDIDYELEGEEHEEAMDDSRYAMKGEYLSDVIRHYRTLTQFQSNYECDEMYLVLSTRYLIRPSILSKLLFLPHWITCNVVSRWISESVLTDLGRNLEFVAQKHAENESADTPWHSLQTPKREKSLK